MKVCKFANKMNLRPMFLVFALLTGGTSCSPFQSRPAFATYVSPENIYRVSLYGEKGRPSFIFTNEVSFSVNRFNDVLVSSRKLHSADSGDLSFELGFPEHAWLAENALRLYGNTDTQSNKKALFVLRNLSGRTVKYFTLRSIDKLLVFDLQPDAKLEMYSSFPRADLLWLECDGEFLDSRSFRFSGDFGTKRKDIHIFTFYLDIHNDGITLWSPDAANL